jgi:hypothetical protein
MRFGYFFSRVLNASKEFFAKSESLIESMLMFVLVLEVEEDGHLGDVGPYRFNLAASCSLHHYA